MNKACPAGVVVRVGQFVEGNIWTRACLNSACGFEGGECVMGGNKQPPIPPGRCVKCTSPTCWLLIGEMHYDE